MIKYRPQRGGLQEAMEQSKEFTDIADMLNYIAECSNGLIKAKNIVISYSNGEDDRIGWKSWRYVCVTEFGSEHYNIPQCIGMCDLGEIKGE